jgi:predicted membrane protein
MTLPTMLFFGVGMLFSLSVALRPMPIFRVLSYGRRFRAGEAVPRSIRVIQVIAGVSVVCIAISFVVEFVQR